MVVVWHFFVTPLYGVPGLIPSAVRTLGELGWSGVDLFFVLSGFLIGGILIDSRSSPNYFRVFYTRRFYRIVPIYSVLLLLFWAGLRLSYAVDWQSFHWFVGQPFPLYAYATYTQNFWMALSETLGGNWLGVTWSLAVEEQFYMTLPLIIWYAAPRHLPYILLGGIVAAPALRTLFYFSLFHHATAGFVLMPCRADALLLGVAGALLLRDQEVWSFLAVRRWFLRGVFALLFFGVGLFNFKGWTMLTMPMTTLGYTWIAMSYLSLLLLVVTDPAGVAGRVLRSRSLVWLGGISYGTYLIHSLIRGICFFLLSGHPPRLMNVSDLMVTVIAILLTIMVAQLSWMYFEKPLVKRAHQDAYKAALQLGTARALHKDRNEMRPA
jgi:peptidoglycan/LPS O-acetylase OafA/YrhL